MSNIKRYLSIRDLQELKELKRALRDKSFSVIVVGLYNSGKSTLLNTLIGDFDMETFKASDARETVENKVFIDGDIRYIDTPGLNATKEDDGKVMEAIKSSDIVLFVHNVTTGELNRKEVEFLNEIKRHWKNPQEFLERTIFILSKIDNIEDSRDIVRTSKKIENQIEEIFNSNCSIIPLSSIYYKEGKVEDEEELVLESNIEVLKREMEHLRNSLEYAILKTKRERLERKIYELRAKIIQKIHKYTRELKELEREKEERDRNLKNDIRKIEKTLKSKYQMAKDIFSL